MEHAGGDEALDVSLELEEERNLARPIQRNLQEGLPNVDEPPRVERSPAEHRH